MKAIFLSDVHLKSMTDPGFEKCISFLNRLRGRDMKSCGLRQSRRLSGPISSSSRAISSISGSRGGGIIYPDFRPVVERLIQLGKSGIRISLCEGNHDFFLADYFSGQIGIEVHPEEVELDLDGLRTHVSHGDTVDRENRRYLALRKFLRSPFSFRLQRLLPLKFLWRLARFSSEMSQGMSRGEQQRLVEVMHRFAVEKYGHGLDAVILGHCHEAHLREERIDGRAENLCASGRLACP